MKALIVVDKFNDFPAATQLCARRIAWGLYEREIEVSVFSTKIDPTRGECGSLGFDVYEVYNIHYSAGYLDRLDQDSIASTDKPVLIRAVRAWDRAKGFLLSADYTDSFACAKNQVALEQVVERVEPDVVISFAFPFSSHRLVSAVRDSVCFPWIAYSLDPYALNYTLSRWQIRRRAKEEASVLGGADAIICDDGVYLENERNGMLGDLQRKVVRLPLPGLDIPDELPSNSNSLGKITLVFCGSFYHDIRNPEPLLKYVEQSALDMELQVFGGISFRVQRIFDRYPVACEKIAFRGLCTKEECEAACEAATVLVNVDNDIPNQVPSKILSYMALGKPILNIRDERVAPSSRYLEKYPLAFDVTKQSLMSGVGVALADAFCSAKHSVPDVGELRRALSDLTSDTVIDGVVGVIKDVCARLDPSTNAGVAGGENA